MAPHVGHAGVSESVKDWPWGAHVSGFLTNVGEAGRVFGLLLLSTPRGRSQRDQSRVLEVSRKNVRDRHECCK